MEVVEDARRWAAAQAAGVVRLLLEAESDLVDVEGAVAAGQFGYAAFMAQNMVIRCLSVLSVRQGGEIQYDTTSVTFDAFAGVDQKVIDAAMALTCEPLDFGSGAASGADPSAWLERLTAFYADIESTLGLPEPLPRLRSPEGMFAALATSREWLSLCSDLGVPVLPISDGDSRLVPQ